jgi:hypothetical protein
MPSVANSCSEYRSLLDSTPVNGREMKLYQSCDSLGDAYVKQVRDLALNIASVSLEARLEVGAQCKL